MDVHARLRAMPLLEVVDRDIVGTALDAIEHAYAERTLVCGNGDSTHCVSAVQASVGEAVYLLPVLGMDRFYAGEMQNILVSSLVRSAVRDEPRRMSEFLEGQALSPGAPGFMVQWRCFEGLAERFGADVSATVRALTPTYTTCLTGVGLLEHLEREVVRHPHALVCAVSASIAEADRLLSNDEDTTWAVEAERCSQRLHLLAEGVTNMLPVTARRVLWEDVSRAYQGLRAALDANLARTCSRYGLRYA